MGDYGLTPEEKRQKLIEAFKARKEQRGNKAPLSFDEFMKQRGVEWVRPAKESPVWEMEYLGEPYQPSEEEQNALSAAEEWLRVPEMFISAKQMKFIADKHKTTIKEMREALNILRRYKHED